MADSHLCDSCQFAVHDSKQTPKCEGMEKTVTYHDDWITHRDHRGQEHISPAGVTNCTTYETKWSYRHEDKAVPPTLKIMPPTHLSIEDRQGRDGADINRTLSPNFKEAHHGKR